MFFAYIIKRGDNMKLYNTLTKKKEEFVPHNSSLVTIYTCGPTVYNYAHIGNLRTYLFEDILVRGLIYLGYSVKRVMNLTDVGHMVGDLETGEDKMVKSARLQGKTPQEIASFYTDAFFQDFRDLNIKMPDIVAKATDHIADYIQVIETLIKKGYAYLSSGNVYFDISRIPNYYELSGKKAEELEVAVRSSVSLDVAKKNPFDFGLWFTKSKFEDQEQKWDSPWGVGYPGWHIECSVLASIYLGEYLDIHCGGVDNIFPHHTNEIAQSEAYFGHPWCRFWLHGNHLNDQTGKMSKSNGEFLTLSVLKRTYDPMVYRYFCLNSHYRNLLVFSDDSMSSCDRAYWKLRKKTLSLKEDGDFQSEFYDSYVLQFKEAFSNDLNTSMMLTCLYNVLKDEKLSSYTKRKLVASFDEVLGLRLLEEFHASVDEDFILEKIKERDLAKQEKDYKKADAIRDALFEENIRLIDTKDGTKYEIIRR